VEERWHFLVLALLTERAISARRSRTATRHHNGHFTEDLNNGNGANGGVPADGDASNTGPELITNGGSELLTDRGRTPLTNGASSEPVAHNGSGRNAAAGITPGPSVGFERAAAVERWHRLRSWLREYFASDHRRALQAALGLLWLIAGALQFQPFMYSHGFIAMLNDTASGQPSWVAGPMNWAANIAAPNLAFFNTLFALTQVAIGLGLLYRQTVKQALAASFVWALVVWWVGEGLGLIFAGTANPLTGAPGAVLLYAIVGLLAWPNDRPGGLLGVRGARTAWVVLWLVMAWAWLLGPNSSPNATSDAIISNPSGLGIVNSLQNALADAAKGNGLIIALVLSLVSVAIAVGVAFDINPRRFLKLAIGLSLAYWVIGQGLGGIFTGTATDLNTGPVFALLAIAVWPLAATSARRFSFTQAAAGVRRELGIPEVAFGPGQTIRRAGLLAASVVAVGLLVLIGVLSGGGSSSPAANAGPLTGLRLLPPPPGSPGPIGPEGLPVPNAPPLAAAATTTTNNAVDGIPSCVRQTQVQVRRQARLTIFVQGFARQLPAGIGIINGHPQYTRRGTYIPTGNCASAVHTNAADGMIEIRSPNQRSYTLGDFFDLWGQQLNNDHVGPAAGPVTVFINGKPYAGNPRKIQLNQGPQIQLEVGTPLVTPETAGTATDL